MSRSKVRSALTDATLDGLFRDASGIGEALSRLRDAMPDAPRHELFYGYFVHENGPATEDYVCGLSRFHALVQAFRRAGGPRTDPVALQARYWKEPRRIDVLRHSEAHRTEDPARRLFLRALYRIGVRTVWLAPLNAPEMRGFGVLNQLHFSRETEPILPPAELIPFGLSVHRAFVRNRVIAREFGVTADDAGLALQLSRGRSISEIAEHAGTTRRTVERRLNRLRARLGARTTAEAIYKATAYGLL